MTQDESDAPSHGSDPRNDAQPSSSNAVPPRHDPVLLPEILALLRPGPGMTYLDCTVGRGGHAFAIASHLQPGGRLIAIDLDAQNLDYARRRLAALPLTQTFVHADFGMAKEVVEHAGLPGVDLLLADLGFASNQVDDPARGFSFTADGPLDMRYDLSAPTTAADLVNRLPQPELADLLFEFGQERLSRKIARKIVEIRRRTPIKTTGQLAAIVSDAYGARARRQRVHPATRTFLALRTAVNQERASLENLLKDLPSLLNPGGVAAIVSFQSLEDRLVKRRFAELEHEGFGTRLTRKPLQPGETELAANPRSRSAKLRALRRLDPAQTTNVS